jgi:uncharacterized protein (TIGR00255 family)
MILSMTGYGTGSAQRDDTIVSVEIKTVNHRFLDLHVRLSREYQSLESEIQQLLRGKLDRGRVDVSVTVQNSSGSAFQINSALIRNYLDAAEKIRGDFNLEGTLDMRAVLTLPGVLQNQEDASVDAAILSELVKQSMQEALAGVLKMRQQEGEALRADMMQNLASIEQSTDHIHALSGNSAAEHLELLRERLAQLLPQGGIDPQRLAQEAALIADKCDIGEEITRMRSHIEQYRKLLEAQEKPGKKLDFLLQEMQREANTILSKSGNLEITQHGISIKTDVEKLREQVQNVE